MKKISLIAVCFGIFSTAMFANFQTDKKQTNTKTVSTVKAEPADKGTKATATGKQATAKSVKMKVKKAATTKATAVDKK